MIIVRRNSRNFLLKEKEMFQFIPNPKGTHYYLATPDWKSDVFYLSSWKSSLRQWIRSYHDPMVIPAYGNHGGKSFLPPDSGEILREILRVVLSCPE